MSSAGSALPITKVSGITAIVRTSPVVETIVGSEKECHGCRVESVSIVSLGAADDADPRTLIW